MASRNTAQPPGKRPPTPSRSSSQASTGAPPHPRPQTTPAAHPAQQAHHAPKAQPALNAKKSQPSLGAPPPLERKMSAPTHLPAHPATHATTGGSNIPPGLGPEFHLIYETLENFVRRRDPEKKPRIVVITDIEQDYDDLLAIIFLAEMHRMGAIELAGCIANHEPAKARAKFLRAVLQLMCLPDVPVAEGTRGLQAGKKADDFFYGLKNKTFRDANKGKLFKSGENLLKELTTNPEPPAKPNRPLTVLLISSLKDISDYLKSHLPGDKGKFHKFVSQGEYTVTKTEGRTEVTLDVDDKKAANNGFDPDAADRYVEYLTKHGLKADAWTKHVAAAASFQGDFMLKLCEEGPIGKHLGWLWLRQEFKFYWDPFNWRFLEHLGPTWHKETRLKLDATKEEDCKLAERENYEFHEIVPKLGVVAYDACAAAGAVGDDFLEAMGVLEKGKGAPDTHRVFGKGHKIMTRDKNGKHVEKTVGDMAGVNPARLAKVLQAFLLGGLKATVKEANAMPEFQNLEYDEVKEKIPAHVFGGEVLNLMKTAFDRQRRLNASTEKARALQKDLNATLETARALEQELKATNINLLTELGRKGVKLGKAPTRDDIPYEGLYTQAMAKVKKVVGVVKKLKAKA